MIIKNLHIIGRSNAAADIKVDDGIISEIQSSGREITNENERSIGFENCIVFPGLINSHDHLEFNLYPKLGHKIYSDYVEWGKDIHVRDKELIAAIEAVPLELRMEYGVIKNLLCGITTAAHHGSYGNVPDDASISIIKNCINIHSVRLGGRWKLKMHLTNSDKYVIHIGEGINAESCDEITELLRWNILKKKFIGVHGIAMTEEQSKSFEALIWCPSSNYFLFDKTADINLLNKHTKILFGSDSTLTGEWNFWEQLRKARVLGLLSDVELFNSVTRTAADVWGLEKTGEISEGNTADLVIAKKKSEDMMGSFYNTNPEDIFLVLRKGELVLFDESLKNEVVRNFNGAENFHEVRLNGRSKFIKYDYRKLLDEIKKFDLSIKLPMDDFIS